MPIVTQCPCGARFQANDELQGKHVTCPQCKSPFTVATLQPIAVSCDCGTSFQAKASLAGKQVKCPSCHGPLQIPASSGSAPATDDPFASEPDPLGLGGSTSPYSDLFAGETIHIATTGPPALSSYTTSPQGSSKQTAPNEKKKKRPTTGHATLPLDGDVLLTVTGILCIIHVLGRIGSMYSLAFFFRLSNFVSLNGLMSLAMLAASGGILAAGVGILTRQPWALQVGKVAGIAYFVVLGLSVIVSLVTLARIDPSTSSSLSGGFLATLLTSTVFHTIAQSIVPGLLVYVTTRDNGPSRIG